MRSLLLLLAALSTACATTDVSTTPASEVSTSTTAANEIATSSEQPDTVCELAVAQEPTISPLREMMQLVPDNDGPGGHLIFSNYAQVQFDRSISTPTTGCDEATFESWAVELYDATVRTQTSAAHPFPGELATAQQTAWGFSLLDVRAELFGGPSASPIRISLVDTPVDEIEDAIESDSDWAADAELMTNTSADLFVDWGNTINSERRSPARPLGRGGSLAVSDGLVVQAFEASTTHASLAARDSSDGLIDRPGYRDLTEYFASKPMHSVFLWPTFDSAQADVLNGSLPTDYPDLQEPLAVGAGWVGTGRKTGTITLVVAMDSPQAAAAAERALVARIDYPNTSFVESRFSRANVAETASTENLVVLTITGDALDLGLLSSDPLLHVPLPR